MQKFFAGRPDPALLERIKNSSAHREVAASDCIALAKRTDRGAVYLGGRRGQPYSVIFKLYSGDNAEELAQRHFFHLVYAHESCNKSEAALVPEPIAMLHGLHGYAMQRVAGESGAEILRRRIVPHSLSREDCLARAAAWLHAYHHSCGWQLGQLSPGSMLKWPSRRLENATASGSAVFDSGEANRIMGLLHDAAKTLGRIRYPKAVLHMDFNLHNIVIDGGSTWGIDFSGRPDIARSVSLDVACCLFWLEFRDRWPGRDGKGMPGGFDRGAINSFSRLYPGIQWQSVETAWLFLHHQMSRWPVLGDIRRVHTHRHKMLQMCRDGADALDSLLAAPRKLR